MVIISPDGKSTRCVGKLEFECSNNQAKYEALIIGLGILINLKAQFMKIIGDSQLMIKQLNEEYQCLNENLIEYYYIAKKQLSQFKEYDILYVKRKMNQEAND